MKNLSKRSYKQIAKALKSAARTSKQIYLLTDVELNDGTKGIIEIYAVCRRFFRFARIEPISYEVFYNDASDNERSDVYVNWRKVTQLLTA